MCRGPGIGIRTQGDGSVNAMSLERTRSLRALFAGHSKQFELYSKCDWSILFCDWSILIETHQGTVGSKCGGNRHGMKCSNVGYIWS